MKNKKYFYGIYGIEFVWHGTNADPELVWHSKSFNYYDVENPLYSDWKEDCEKCENTPEFEIWVKKNAHLARYYLRSLLDAKVFY